jgi:hypothetical protein
MGNELIPGEFFEDQDDYSGLDDSMALAIEEELNALMLLDELPPLETDPGDPSVRDRRRLFVAIARGVVRHLRDNKDSIDILLSDGATVHPTVIRTSGL